MTCCGCGEKGHGMYICQIINKMLENGTLTKDRAGRIIKGDCSWIRRQGDEPLIKLLGHEGIAQTHLVMMCEPRIIKVCSEGDKSEYELVTSQKGKEISLGDDMFAIKDFTFVAERPEKQITAKRKQLFDGVYPPRRGKENQPPRNEDTGRILQGNKGVSMQQQKIGDYKAIGGAYGT